MYKKSMFNLFFDHQNQAFIYNSHTGGFVTLNDEYKRSFKLLSQNNWNEIPNEHIKNFKDGGFIVDKDLDEYLIYKYLTNRSKYSNDSFALTIATTLQCNFRCPYCYEEHVDSYFDEKKEEELKKFILDNLDGKKNLSITWYGGEPLLQKAMINRVSKEIIQVCEENNIHFQSDIVSNGYLLTKEVAKSLVEDNKVTSVQITLDGGPETHDQTRILRNGNGTFEKILQNIKDIKDIIQVIIRVNVSQQNVHDIHKLIPILIENDLNNKVSLYLSPVTASEGTCQSVSESCLRTEEFSKHEMELIEYADKLGFEMGNLYPFNLGGNVCTAVNNNSFVVDSDGNLFKCWNEVGKENLKVGTIIDGVTNTKRYINWVEWDFPSKCRECSIFPLCKGRCPDLSKDGQNFECNQLKFNIIDRLMRYYQSHSNITYLDPEKIKA
ncbi:radical SAM/SPASM domain-containing protein [Paenibacillus illinoisensis]|uniref:radical SAM/SPASM domain-containing protein n=1 Tax=Paenibacillus illinoisensis TaxID=59845 RepID=UPI0020421D60|nr:radical SAM protein [Paenibacillus illinoisensis]MCM3205983.1 radical SAM protein [Paenibacillus illinoisensis]